MVHVYGGARKLTLSTYSYPMRVIISKLSAQFKFNNVENKHYDCMIFNI